MRARFVRFSAIGLAGAALQVALFGVLLKWFHFPQIAAPLAVELVVLHNFYWHERITWSDRGPGGLRRLCRFHASNGLVSLAGNTILAYWLVQRLDFPAVPSQVAAIAVCAPLNFLVADRWVYRLTRCAPHASPRTPNRATGSRP